MAITREDVVRTAVRLLNEIGLERLTLRRLAAELGVSAPTLYWHVRDKRALLDLVADAIASEHRPAPQPAHGQPWWEWLAANAVAHYQALVSHRDSALVVAGNRPTPDTMPRVEETTRSLVDVGFPPGEALRVLLSLGQFVMGSVVEHQAEAARPAPSEEELADRMRILADLPVLIAASRAQTFPDPEAIFRYGLDLMMAGLRARHAELTGTASVRS